MPEKELLHTEDVVHGGPALPQETFDASYYLRGRESGKSLYVNYRWLPDLSIPLARRIVAHLGAAPSDTFLDFGCARGYMVRALREIGYEAEGIDCSEWATENADPAVRDFVKQALLPDRLYDWILAKDVLEHVPGVQLDITLDALARCARKGVFIVVPLSPAPYAPYAVADFEKDVTHVHRFTLMDWHRKIADACGPDFKVESTFRIRGMKDNYGYGEQSEGNGFVTCSRWNPWAVSEPLGGG